MNWQRIRAIAKKDLLEVSRNRAAIVPSLVVPLVFVVVLPLIIIFATGHSGMQTAKTAETVAMLRQNLPATVTSGLAGMSDHQAMVLLMLGYMMAPMFLVLPMMLATIVGADSFAGEKERKTLEALLYTPATDAELFIGKTLAAVVPAVLLAWGSFAVYALVVNLAGYDLMGRIWFPTAQWWPMMLWVTPAIAVMGMAVTVLVSAKVSTFMEANQAAGMLVFLVLALVAGQATGVLYLGTWVAIALGTVFWLVNVGLVTLAVRKFSRSALLSRR
ncbi:ABC transporter permease subunit [bacterium]|nr:ABC transporter permease subunit [bacterium]